MPGSKRKEGERMEEKTMGITKRSLVLLTLVCLAALALRLLPLLCNWEHPNIFMQYDSPGYHWLAKNLIEGNGYSWNETEPYEINVYRPPGMPAILWSVYSLFGPSIPHAIVLQVIVSTSVVLVTFLVASMILGERTALIAAALQALDPVSIVYSNLLLTEVYSSAIIISAAYLTGKYMKTQARGALLMIGALIGIGILIHPILVFLPFFIIILPFCVSKTRLRGNLLVASLAVLIGIAPAACWIARNARVADYAGISCVTAVNLMKYKAAGVMAELRGTSLLAEAQRLRDECEATLPPDATRGDRWRAWQRKARSILLAHPLVYMKLHINGMLREFSGPGRDNLTRLLYGSKVLNAENIVTDQSIRNARENESAFHLDAVRYVALLFQASVYLFFFVGLAGLLVRKHFVLALWLMFPIAYVLMVSGGPEAFSRFRVTYMPFISIVAGFGLHMILDLIYKRHNRAAAPQTTH